MMATTTKSQSYGMKTQSSEDSEYDRIMKKYNMDQSDGEEQDENMMEQIHLSTHNIGFSKKVNQPTPQKLKLITIDVNDLNASPTPSFQNTPQHLQQVL